MVDSTGVVLNKSSLNEPIDSSDTKKQDRVSLPNYPQEQAILNRLGQMTQDINNFLDVFIGDLGALLEMLCQLELEGKVIVSGQRVRRNN